MREKIQSELAELEQANDIKVHFKKLPEGVYLATSNDVQGLVAQGRTVAETLEIAKAVARKLVEAQSDVHLAPFADQFLKK